MVSVIMDAMNEDSEDRSKDQSNHDINVIYNDTHQRLLTCSVRYFGAFLR